MCFNLKLPFDPPRWLVRRAEEGWKSPHRDREYRCQIDFLHPTYPESPLEMIPKAEQTRTSTVIPDDLLISLPLEIFEEVMLLLSTPSLDAARFVSRKWWVRIMSSAMLLRVFSNPLAINGACLQPSLVSPGGLRAHQPTPLRDLARVFDKNSHPLTIGRHGDQWRVRYRANDVEFRPLKSQDQRVLDTAILLTGSMIGFLVETNVRSDSQIRQKYSVLIYMIRISGEPFLVRDLDVPEGCSKPVSVNLLKGSFPENWILELNCESQHFYMSSFVASSPPQAQTAYSGPLRSVFRLMNQNPAKWAGWSNLKSPESWVMGTWTREESRRSRTETEIQRLYYNSELHNWIFLEKLPVTIVNKVACNDFPVSFHWIAQNRQTGQLFVVKIKPRPNLIFSGSSSEPAKSLPTVIPVSLLSSPYKHNTYKNVAVAPFLHRGDLESSLRVHVGVIWSEEANSVDSRGVLFLYVVPFEYPHSLANYEVDVNGDSLPLDKWELLPELEQTPPKLPILVDPEEYSQLKDWLAQRSSHNASAQLRGPQSRRGRLCGKRVCSLPASAGGLHQALDIPARRQGSDRGGIQTIGVCGIQFFIWGPSDEKSSPQGVNLKILDIPMFGTHRMNWSRARLSRESVQQVDHVNVPKSCILPYDRFVLPESSACACELHDTSWAVVFPAHANSDRRRSRDDFFVSPKARAAAAAAARAIDPLERGSVTHVRTPIAEAALERRNREIYAHLDCLKARTRQGFGYEPFALR